MGSSPFYFPKPLTQSEFPKRTGKGALVLATFSSGVPASFAEEELKEPQAWQRQLHQQRVGPGDQARETDTQRRGRSEEPRLQEKHLRGRAARGGGCILAGVWDT